MIAIVEVHTALNICWTLVDTAVLIIPNVRSGIASLGRLGVFLSQHPQAVDVEALFEYFLILVLLRFGNKVSQGEIGSQLWDKNGRSSPTQFFQIIDNENGEQVNDTGKMWRHDRQAVLAHYWRNGTLAGDTTAISTQLQTDSSQFQHQSGIIASEITCTHQ